MKHSESLEVEPLRRRRFLAPGQTEGDVFSDSRPNSPVIIRVGRAYLCSLIPNLMDPGY